MDTNDKVFKSEMAIALYEAYEEFLSIPDFSGHKTIDAMNYMADKLEKKGYGVCIGLPTEPSVIRESEDFCSKAVRKQEDK